MGLDGFTREDVLLVFFLALYLGIIIGLVIGLLLGVYVL